MGENGNCVHQLYNCVMAIAHHTVARTVATLGVDFVWIDALHSSIDADNLFALIQPVNFPGHGKTVAVVRVPSEHSHLLRHALDAGADGIIIPRVKSAEQAAEAVRKCRYACLGGERSLSQFALVPGVTDGAPPGLSAERVVDQHIVLICQIEVVVFENVEDIARTAGVNALMVGPGDLRLSFGVPSKQLNGQDAPCYEEAIRHIAAISHRYRKPLFNVVTKMSSSSLKVAMLHRSGLLVTGVDLWSTVNDPRRGLEEAKSIKKRPKNSIFSNKI
ncbi:Pyruvate/Phosphoenolpyruvate kinase-like domain-containing protein [Aspergillus pseudoustus]|uniref:Pyruvate/Phosphoenolpyruvate kinase-like domain-containing protein n=1 Tax=Aspergillus pseudoustus TaxID=1810923 RepID=A0ABR4K754_9EURO